MPTCMTVDVEDWYDGMAQLGHRVDSRPSGTGLDVLTSILGSAHRPPGAPAPRLTLFVVGSYAPQISHHLRDFAAAGHELASHGPDHGTLPEDARQLENWLREGRERVEEVVELPIMGFRSPRFSLPGSMRIEEYREVLARAGFKYVSDRHFVGISSAVGELPVLEWRGVPIGGGSYQRMLPTAGVRSIVRRLSRDPSVLYYHSYDFGGILPSPRTDRSPAVLRYSLGRRRIETIFADVLATMGSVSCREALHGV